MAHVINLPHAVIGGSVGLLVESRLSGRRRLAIGAALAVGMGTHVLADMIPHAEYGFDDYLPLAVDLICAALIVWFARLSLAGAFGAILPDVLQGTERLLGIDITRSLHGAWHTTTQLSTAGGVATQALAVLTALGLVALWRLHRGVD